MATATGTGWRPSWWKEETHGSTWERVKEALRRDWEQTKKDFGGGGHELNQDVSDTVKQALGKESIPEDRGANPPRIIGDWSDVEEPMGYGYSARTEYGTEHATWNDDVETRLRSEWESRKGDNTRRNWDEVRHFVRHGYDRAKDYVP